ncbi:MAG: hypothetical protein M3Y67_02105, partial [Pseudomonadota bacterium]|nr:hypothetical protein [Pseudomonadota bacterium]
MPRWLLLILLGAVLGAGGVLFVQQRYLPPRLTADESAKLRQSFEQANAERQRLQNELTGTSKRLEAALADTKRLAAQAGSEAGAVQRLREDVASLVAALPPDPRNGPISVRAARFEVQGDALAYDVVLSRERTRGNPFGGVLQFVVAGSSSKGGPDTVALKPVPISVDLYD